MNFKDNILYLRCHFAVETPFCVLERVVFVLKFPSKILEVPFCIL